MPIAFSFRTISLEIIAGVVTALSALELIERQASARAVERRGTAKPYDSDGHSPLHAVDECFLKEAGQSQSRLRSTLRVLQFLSDTQVVARDACDGSCIDRSHLEHSRTAGMTEPFNSQELMQLLRGLEQRSVPCEITHRRVTGDCDGIIVRISTATRIWEVGFYDNAHIEVLKYVLSDDAQTGVTAESILSAWDAI